MVRSSLCWNLSTTSPLRYFLINVFHAPAPYMITTALSVWNSLCFFVKFSLVKQSSKPITEIIQMKILLLPELARELKHK